MRRSLVECGVKVPDVGKGQGKGGPPERQA